MAQAQTTEKKRTACNNHQSASTRKRKLTDVRTGVGHFGVNIGEKSLVRCVEHKLRNPGVRQTGIYHRKCILPIARDRRELTTNRSSTIDLSKSEKSSGIRTGPPSFRLDGARNTCRKSLSMIDLTSGSSDLRSEGSSNSVRDATERTMNLSGVVATGINGSGCQNDGWPKGTGSGDVGLRSVKTVDKAASVVCHLLAINAWRRRREEVAGLQDTIDELGQQVDHLRIQIVVLRRLLHTENCRVEKFGGDFHRVKTQLEETSRERNDLKNDKEKLEEDVKRSKMEYEELTVAKKNLINESMTLRAQLQALDTQITRDREKLLKLREDKKILLDKVCTTEALVEERGARAKRAEASIVELETTLAAREIVVAGLKEDNQKFERNLKATETEKLRLERRLRLSEDAGRALSLRAANLEMQLDDRESALRRMESAHNLQLKELNELREQLHRRSHEGGWSSRVLQIAGSVVWAPRAILRSLSFLSTTGTP